MDTSSEWHRPTRSEAAARLVCFPYAGGGAAGYHRWRPAVPGWLDLLPLELPGREGRVKERPYTDLRQLAATLADKLQPILNRPYAFLGHSMGAWLALEVAREMRRRGVRLPELLVVAASRPPQVVADDQSPPLHRLPDEELVAAVVERYDGIPPAIRASPELLQLLLPALRADLQMVETYRCTEEPPLETPILALGGTEDRAVPLAQLGEWRRHTARDFSMRLLPGGHFFLFQGKREERPSALLTILARMDRVRKTEPAAAKPPD